MLPMVSCIVTGTGNRPMTAKGLTWVAELTAAVSGRGCHIQVAGGDVAISGVSSEPRNDCRCVTTC